MKKKGKSQVIAETLYSVEANPKRILDVGFAQGPTTHLSKGDVYGIDIFEIGLPQGYKEVKRVDLNEGHIPYEDGFFDAVTMGCVLAHVANPLQLLEELHRVVKPGGVVVLSSPNPQYYWEGAMNTFFNFFKKRVPKVKFVEHFYSFSRYNMRTVAERTGFTVEKEVGFTFYFVKIGFSFNPIRWPGIAYEIVYVLRKTSDIQRFTTFESPTEGVIKVPTNFRTAAK